MSDKPFNKQNLDFYLRELAKEFRKHNGEKMPAEIVLIGGASIVINYGFREMTYDMDAIIQASSVIKDAINTVGDRYHLPKGWLNTNFVKTASYTHRILEYSKYYRTYSNIVTFRTVTGEYLVAMKMMAGREYKFDRSDIVGILMEHQKQGKPLTLKAIKQAAEDLYDSYESIPKESREFVENTIKDGNYEKLFERVRQLEKENREILISFTEDYPGVANKDNANEIISLLRQKKESKDN